MNIAKEARKSLFIRLESDGTIAGTPLERQELELMLGADEIIEMSENSGELKGEIKEE